MLEMIATFSMSMEANNYSDEHSKKLIRLVENATEEEAIAYAQQHQDTIDFRFNDSEALIEAAYRGYLDVVKYLLEKEGEKADIRADDDFALRFAAVKGHLNVVKYLLEKEGDKANIHADDDEALREAAERGSRERTP